MAMEYTQIYPVSKWYMEYIIGCYAYPRAYEL